MLNWRSCRFSPAPDRSELHSDACGFTSRPLGVCRCHRCTQCAKRFQPGDIDERPWRGGDTLILRAGPVRLSAVCLRADSGCVLKAWTQPFKPNLTRLLT